MIRLVKTLQLPNDVLNGDLIIENENPFGCPTAGECCIDHGGIVCGDTDCCRRVSSIDPFCCDVAWDPICASEAAGFEQCGCVPVVAP